MKEYPQKEPDRIDIDKSDRQLYDRLKEEKMFSQKENKDLFLMAMALGFSNGVKRTIKNREGYVRTEYLSAEDKALIYAVALSESSSVDILSEKDEVFRIAEDYAHAGIKILHGSLGQLGSYPKQLEKDLDRIYKEVVSERI